MAYTELPVRTRGVCCELEPAPEPAELGAAVEVLKALADPTRLSMVVTLRKHEEPVCICDLVAVYALGQPTISHHMRVLRDAGLIESEKRGLWRFYTLRRDLPPAIRRLIDDIA